MTRLAAWLLAAFALWPQAVPGQTQPVRVHHDLHVTLEPNYGRAMIGEELRVIGAASAVLALPEGFGMNRMKIGETGATMKRSDGVWQLDFEGGAEHRMALTYKGPLARFDEAERGAGFTGAEGSYLPSRGGWYPDFGADLFSYTLEVDLPDDQRAVAPGRLVHETVAEGRYRAKFAVDWPAEDVVVMAGPYDIGERRHGDIRLRTYFHPEVAALSDAYLEKSGEYLDHYAAAIGDYPFPAFHVVSSPLPVGLGYPGLAYIGRRVLRLPFILETSLGHEVLHNWWGNGVYVDYAAGNWSEGLTTFMADYAIAEAKGTARAMRLRWLNDYAALPSASDEPLSAFTGPSHGAARVTGYAKAAMLFVMLRDDIGAETFDAGIRRFWQGYRFRRAAWFDLQRSFEHASGRDLGRFFGQWIEQTGAPALRLKSVKATVASGGHRVSFTLIQDAPAYVLSVPVTIETEAGARHFRVPFDDRIERYALDVEARPLALEIDPDGRLFRRLGRGEVPAILRSVILAPKVVLSVAADDDDDEYRAAADALAAGLVEGEVEVVERFAAPLFNEPLILVGWGGRLGRLVASAGLLGTPVEFIDRGEARIWTGMGARGFPALVIEAESAAVLGDLAARLPHYGAKSYLLFEDGEVTVSGTWEPAEKPLRFEFP